MRGINFTRDFLPHLGVIAFFFLLTVIYFYPAFEGKVLQQHDVKQWEAKIQEAQEYNQTHDDRTFWTNAVFGGMPTYMMLGGFESAWIVSDIFQGVIKSMPEGSGIFFFALISFYVMLVAMGLSIPLSIIGALAFGLCSNIMISIGAGHITKTKTMAIGPLVIMAIYLTMRKRKLWLGAALTACFLALNISLNHPQVTYYLGIMAGIYMITELVMAYKSENLKPFFKGAGLLIIAVIIAIGANIAKLGITYEYSQESTRGETPLTMGEQDGGGLSKSYVMRWSYGIAETGNLMIPNLMGGTSSKSFVQQDDSETLKALRNIGNQGNIQQIARHTTQYWGAQPMTSGPVYLGAVACYLFILGLFLLRGPVKWWLVIVVVLSIMLAWGKNFMVFNNLFYHYFPFYNKFRTVTMILYLVQFAVPLLGILGLQKMFSGDLDKATLQDAIKKSFFIAGGFCLVFALIPGMFFDFTAGGESTQFLRNNAPEVLEALKSDRQSLLQADAFRSLIFVSIGAGVLFLYTLNLFNSKWAFILLGGAVLVDLWAVDKRYLSKDDFKEPTEVQEFSKSRADRQILQDKHPNYRVLNLTVSPFNDATTSYYHKTIGGYHGAKMGRYEDLIKYQLNDDLRFLQQNLRSGGMVQRTKQNPVRSSLNPEKAKEISVLNMLNMKYLILPGRQGESAVYNPAHYGNAWFVKDLKKAENANEVMKSLDEIDLKTTAVYNKEFSDYLKDFDLKYDPGASIEMTNYKPNEIVYQTSADQSQFAVFSEIYYNHGKGWKVFVDGERQKHIRLNYVLRGMKVPSGEHEIRFKFDPDHVHKLIYASLTFSLIIVIGVVGIGGYSFYLKANQPGVEQASGSSANAQAHANKQKRKGKGRKQY